MRRWTTYEVDFIKKCYRKVPASMIAKQLDRKLLATYQKANELGITLPTKINFSPLEEKFLRQYYLKMTNAELSAELGKKKTIVRMKLYELGLRRYDQKARGWSAEEDKILIDNYQTTGDVALSKMIAGRTKGGICKRRKTLKLTRTPDQIAALVELGKQKFLQHTFKAGHTNKIPAESVPKIWETRRKNMIHKEPLIQPTQFILNP